MRRLLLVALVLLAGGCAAIDFLTGGDHPKCKPKCAETEFCQWEWTECSGPFATTCHHSEKAICKPVPAADAP